MSLIGAAKEREEVHPPDRADDLAGVVLKDLDGKEVRLGTLWSERPVALAFLRHYG
jgi:hypothetical protein